MQTGPSVLNRAFNRVPKRAESGQIEQLRETFVDSGVAAVLESPDHQVLYGRRGTGKTHALRYLETVIQGDGDIAVYIDLRTVGSLEGVFAGEGVPPYERAARLLVDIIYQVHDALLQAALDNEGLIGDPAFTSALDELEESVTSVRLTGSIESQVETTASSKTKSSISGEVSVSASNPSARVGAGSERESGGETRSTDKISGAAQRHLNFSDVATALRLVSQSLNAKRLWILFDEWSSVLPETQPYLGDFLVRCITPLPKFVVKIAAIEQQSNFRVDTPAGPIGIELGADVAANVSLDEFMVFEQNEDLATEFFQGLFFKHLTSDRGATDGSFVLKSPQDVLRQAFTERRSFRELVRAAEGVPRDAINVAAKAALRSGQSKISTDDVRVAARQWFQSDKEAAIGGRDEARRLLNWIVDEVIRGKRARAFLVNQEDVHDSLLLALFDARLLHVLRKGYSAQDYPGQRFDIYAIDYGTYVDLIGTKSEPIRDTLFDIPELSGDDVAADIEVPQQDLRAVRRTILDLSRFYSRDYTNRRYR